MKNLLKKATGFATLACLMVIGINTANAQIGMSGNNPDKSAALDLNATNKGLLVPRISLSSLTDKTSIAGGNPANSLMVFNTNTSLTGGVGFYYWDNTASTWKKLITSGDVAGDNLGNHTATTTLNMNSNRINNINDAYFKDQIAANTDSYGLYKNNGIFGIYSSKNSGNDFTITESNRRTGVNNLSIAKGTDGVAPAAGSIAASADASGNVVWKTPASIVAANQTQADWNMATTSDPAYIKNKPAIPTVTGAETKITAGTNVTVTGTGATGSPYVVNAAGDNLGNHTATQNLNMSSKDITAAANITATAKTATNTLAVAKGSDNNAPAAGAIATAADTNGNLIWKTPASIVTANQTQADWNMATTSDPAYIKNKPTITAADGSETKIEAGTNVTITGTGTAADKYKINATGDNLGNHTATTTLNMNNNRISTIYDAYFKDQIAANTDSYGLYKNNGVFGIYSSKNSGNDFTITESTRRTGVNNLSIAKGTDGVAPAAGSIAASADASGNVVWKTPASIVAANQTQADWNMATTSDPAYIKNKPTITAADGSETKIEAGTNVTITGTGTAADKYKINATGDNLGNHTATTALNMSKNKINNIDVAGFSDQTTSNTDIYGLFKKNGDFGFYSSKNAGYDLYTNEGSRKTTINNLAIVKGTDGSAPATGSVPVAADASGNLVWKPASSIGAGDNLGNHTATKTLDMAKNNIDNINNAYVNIELQIRDRATTNTNYFGLYKNSGTFGVYNSSKSGNDLTIDEATRKTSLNNLAISKGTDGSAPATGSVAVAADANGNVVWKPASSIGAGDNLGNHTATTTLNMNSNRINNINDAYFKDQVAANTDSYGLFKNNGVFGIYSSKNSGNDFTITESTRRTGVNNLSIAKGTDGSTPATGSVAVAADANGNVVWKPASSIGAGDNLGNHTATTTLNMNTNRVDNVKDIYFKDQTATNNNTTTLWKKDGAFGIYSSKNNGNDLYIDEATRKTTLNNLSIIRGTDGKAPVAGYVATAADNQGNVIWSDISSISNSIPKRYEYSTGAIAPENSKTVTTESRSSTYMLVVKTYNDCSRFSIATFMVYNGVISFLGGQARDVLYKTTIMDANGTGQRLETERGVTHCDDGGTAIQFNYDITTNGKDLTITNRGNVSKQYFLSVTEM